MQTINSNHLNGIDVSNWQGTIDFKKVKSSGIQIVYTKVSEGTNYIDPFFKANYNGAKAQGLKVGFYHFFKPDTQASAIAQANYFAAAISGLNPDCKLALDLETTNGLDSQTLSTLADIFLKQVKKVTGLDVVLYTYSNFALNNLTTSLSIYPLWIAQYGVQTPSPLSIWSAWTGFQYSDSGSIPGIGGNVDLDSFTNGILLNSKTPIPTPPSHSPQPLPVPPKNSSYYTVQSGDTLSGIASEFGLTTSVLASINHISNPNLIYPGQTLTLLSKRSSTSYYTVKNGDTLSKIASEFGLTTSVLARVNHITNVNLIYPGQILKLLSTSSPITRYTVQSGDTLSAIATKFGVTTDSLAHLNNISNPNMIYPGQIIKI